jgi:divalent metal cation (Fe/Co/Zn/Cd) transporter
VAKKDLLRRAKVLAWFTVIYNLLEAAASIFFGSNDGSLSLVGFGGDSLIEAGSAAVVLWRFQSVVGGKEDEREKAAQKWIGTLLMALGLYLAISATFEFRRGAGPSESAPGIVISLISLAVMGWLYRAKIACASGLKSAALKADAFCTLSCMWLSGLLLLGSALLAGTGLLWFDALTTAGMAFLIVREGFEEYEEATE